MEKYAKIKANVVLDNDVGGDITKIIAKCKNPVFVKIKAKGKEAHGSRPWEGIDANELMFRVIENIRKIIPDVSIRTAFIVGYPGETDEHFEHLCNFVRDMKFDRMGVFCYSREKGTPSYSMKPQVSKKVAKSRWKKLMEIQQGI